MACFDELAEAPYLALHRERYALAQSIIDELGNYPKPREKGAATEPSPEVLAAYLYVSTARNTLKLAQLGFIPFGIGLTTSYECFERAMSLLTDNQ